MLNDVVVDVSDVSVTSSVTYKIQVPTAAAAKILETQLADTTATEAMLTAVAKEAGIAATSVTLGAVTSVDADGSLDWKKAGGSVDISAASSAAPAVLVALAAVLASL